MTPDIIKTRPGNHTWKSHWLKQVSEHSYTLTVQYQPTMFLCLVSSKPTMGCQKLSANVQIQSANSFFLLIIHPVNFSKKKRKKKLGLKLSGLWSQVVMQFSTFAAQGSLCILKIVNHFQTSGYNFYFKDEVVFSLFYNAPFVVASFDLLNILNITWNTNIVMYKQIYLLLCLIVSWHASF